MTASPELAPAGAPQLRTATAWRAVLFVTATSFALVTGEFLPQSLLPAMASSLHISEGQAGEAVAATALLGLISAPTLGALVPRMDRRTLLTLLALAAAVSNAAVAVAPVFLVVIAARMLLGIAIGGFWALSLTVATRLSTPTHVPRALSLINFGGMFASVAGVPLGIQLGERFGWRTAFAVASVAMALVAIALRITLPATPAAASVRLRAIAEALKSRVVAWGLVGHVLTMFGHFVAFSYIRAALALSPHLDTNAITLSVGIFGIGSVIGNVVTGLLIARFLRALRVVLPLLVAVPILVLSLAPQSHIVLDVAVVVWGCSFGGWLTVVMTWIGRAEPDRLEAGGGLVVGGFQAAVTVGAVIGGALLDGSGIRTALLVAAAAAAVGSAIFGTAPERHS
jgi:predicted MFS family arabinose efflux permease